MPPARSRARVATNPAGGPNGAQVTGGAAAAPPAARNPVNARTSLLNLCLVILGIIGGDRGLSRRAAPNAGRFSTIIGKPPRFWEAQVCPKGAAMAVKDVSEEKEAAPAPRREEP